MEWVFAAQWAHYKFEEFEQLPGERQAVLIAAYRAKQQIEAVLSEHSAMEARRQQAEAELKRQTNPMW